MKYVLSCLVAFLFTLPSAADDVVNLLGNIISENVTLDSTGESAAQAFVTGSDFLCLDHVTIRLINNHPSPSSARVEVWAGVGNIPETKITEIGVIPSIIGDQIYRGSPDDHPILSPNTRYWIVISNVSGNFEWRATDDPTTTGTSSGQIEGFRAGSEFGEFWNGGTNSNFLLIRVEASVCPTLTVTSELDDGSDGTLRDTISDALDGTRIVFSQSLVEKTIRLNGNELVISKNLLIDASDHFGGIRISGDKNDNGFDSQDSRVFSITAGKTVIMKLLTITGGRAPDTTVVRDGGGIYNSGFLTLQRCTITNNRSGNADGTGDGGYGGGIYNYDGTLTLQQCTVSHNRTGDSGNGTLSDGGLGGGIHNDGGIITLTQSTIANNQCGNSNGTSANAVGGVGGGVASFELLRIEQCTIVGNRCGDGFTGGSGGGIFHSGNEDSISIKDSIIAGNSAGNATGGGSEGTIADILSDNTVTTSGINIIGENTGVEDAFPASSRVGTAANPVDPVLGPLSSNGGPTQTMLPQRGSPALNPTGGATTSRFATDQRGPGFTRIIGGIIDPGAVEGPAYSNPAARARILRQIRKLKKKLKTARRKKQVSKVKRFKKKLKKLKRQLRAV